MYADPRAIRFKRINLSLNPTEMRLIEAVSELNQMQPAHSFVSWFWRRWQSSLMAQIVLTVRAKRESLVSSEGVSLKSHPVLKNVTEMSNGAIQSTYDGAAVRGAGAPSTAVRRPARADAGAGLHTAGPAVHSRAVCSGEGACSRSPFCSRWQQVAVRRCTWRASACCANHFSTPLARLRWPGLRGRFSSAVSRAGRAGGFSLFDVQLQGLTP